MTQNLNGVWDYRIGDGAWGKKRVPYSDRPVGFAEVKRKFDRMDGERAFLIFDGITYSADVTLNGQSLGSMLPYSRYEFEVTDILKDTDNELLVKVIDTTVTFGPSEGWENYSGIIRDVYIEYTAKSRIADIIWTTDFNDDFTQSTAHVKVLCDLNDEQTVSVTICDDKGVEVATADMKADAEVSFDFDIDNPRLWSPDSPRLYTLTTTLSNGECDIQKVGFKQLTVSKKRFILNGEPLFLVGVCRHDLYGDQGHVMTEEQMRYDMQMIKDAGCNFVRLVHYPHHKTIVDIADEIGLMVSEEPGLWWSDVKNEEIFNGSLEVLRRIVLRDRNRVSMAFWLSFNECMFTPEYLVAAAKVCRDNDPTHLCSGANCMDIPMTKKHFAECGLDFYTMHPYSPSFERMIESAEELNDKPLMLTEWGGYHVYENPHLFKMFVEEMIKLWQNDDDKPVLAGAAAWCWSEVFEFNRSAPACYDGVLCEGLVDRYRNPRSTLKVFTEMYAKINEKPQQNKSVDVCGAVVDEGDYRPLELKGENQEKAWETMMEHALVPISRFVFVERKQRVLDDGPVLPFDVTEIGNLPVELHNKPICVNAETPLTFKADKGAKAVWFVGNVSMPKGFPIGGVFGEQVGEIVFEYADGTTETTPLRNGMEISTACAWFGPSRINPRASHAPRALHFINHTDREFYVANLYKLALDSAKEVSNITLKVTAEEYDLLTYGATEQM